MFAARLDQADNPRLLERISDLVKQIEAFLASDASSGLPWADLLSHESWPDTVFVSPRGNFLEQKRNDRPALLDEEGNVDLEFVWPQSTGQLVDLLEWAYRTGFSRGETAGGEIVKLKLRQLLGVNQ